MISIQEVAKMLGISRQTLYKLMDSKEIAFYQIAGRRKFKKSEVTEYIERQKNK